MSTSACEAFGELADALGAARSSAATAPEALKRVAHTYIGFTRDNPAVYDAMFTRAASLPLAAADTPPELIAAFTQLRDACAAAMTTSGWTSSSPKSHPINPGRTRR